MAADNAIISPSSISSDSSATASPASRGLGGMRRGFLQDRATRGFGEEHSHSPQLTAGASIAGECVCARARAYVCSAGRTTIPVHHNQNKKKPTAGASIGASTALLRLYVGSIKALFGLYADTLSRLC